MSEQIAGYEFDRNQRLCRALRLSLLCSLTILFGHRLTNAQVPTHGGQSVFTDPKTAMRGRFDELVGLVQCGEAPSRGWAMSWLGRTEWPDGQADKVITLLCEVLESPDEFDREPAAEALRDFAQVNSAHASIAVGPLISATKTADEGELVEIAGALAEIGTAASESIPNLRVMLRHTTPIVRIHAATALYRVQPNSREAMEVLLGALSDDDAGYRWRAADGLRHIGTPAKSAATALRRSLGDDDPRVRVTAAGAVWAVERDVEVALPQLIHAMCEEDLPLATKFIYPSFHGDSHRVYAARVLGDMGPTANASVPVLIEAVKATMAESAPTDEVVVCFAAITALGKIGPAAHEALPTLREAESLTHANFSYVVSRAIARIEEAQ